ncbi:MAG: 3-deoxy-8-phosphooctulonate synthase [Lentimicrobiaceae bacterium]|nr:3-deoxy-8-phosphooctulonate synthase [Lentimicrobiaceae bacterium]
MNLQTLPKIKYTDKYTFFLIAGPCVVEDGIMPFTIAQHIKEVTDRLQIPYIFKASYRKANRSRLDSFTGIGDQRGLETIQAVGNELDLPTLTDFHSAPEADLAARYADILQIPAFLCRQTDILVAAAKTNQWINIKKGQFLSPDAIRFAIDKVRQSGNDRIMVTERGTTFGYQDLVVDFRSIPLIRQMGVSVVLDVTHSLQQPNQLSGVTGGMPEMIETLAKAGIAAGVDGIFIETHPDPPHAKSDGANMLPLAQLEPLLVKLLKIRNALE